MSFPELNAPLSLPMRWLIGGGCGGYVLMMLTAPVRASLRDGFRCLHRYATLWLTLGAFGCAYALFQLALRVYFHWALPPAERPAFAWMREAWRDPQYWLHGSAESLWYLPAHALHETALTSILPALESVAGIFNCAVITFPLSALAAVMLLVNWGGHHVVLARALWKRLGAFAWLAHAGIIVCALAAAAKPFVYAAPQLLGLRGVAAVAWFQWAPVAEWLAFLFEGFLGVCIQIYLILLAYCWVRGVTVQHQQLLDFAIRRFSLVLRWTVVVMALGTLFVSVPLILKNFAPFSALFPPAAEKIAFRMLLARSIITGVLLLFATMQITLTFHSESLGKAVQDHWHFLARHGWAFGWFLIVAAVHFYLLQFGRRLVQIGLGEGTAAGILWSLIVPWLQALVAAWLLASWVCLYKRCETGRLRTENWIKF